MPHRLRYPPVALAAALGVSDDIDPLLFDGEVAVLC